MKAEEEVELCKWEETEVESVILGISKAAHRE